MELEGFGVSLVGHSVWLLGTQWIPWEFLQGHTSLRILIRGSKPTPAEAESTWNCIWCSPQSKDWSCIATILRGAAFDNCLLVLDHVDPPATFWQYLDSMVRGVMTKIWIHETAPAFVPDAVFVPPLTPVLARQAWSVFHALPARKGHGTWTSTAWDSIVAATSEQGLGLVVSDIEEPTWTLMWHRMDDSRLPIEKASPIASQWMKLGFLMIDRV